MEFLPIGRFARVTGLTVRALRHYHELGLLEPARVDTDTGYRLYELDQAEDAELIRRLRELGLPLGEIRAILAGADALERLRAHREHLAARIEELDRVINGEEPLVPEGEKFTIHFKLEIDEGPPRLLRFAHDGPRDHLKGSYRLLEQVIADNGLVPAGDPSERELESGAVEITWPIGPEGELERSRDTFIRRIEVDA
jgi:DNA-binding transcriptional MerR regulator